MAQAAFVLVEPSLDDVGNPLPVPAPNKITAYVSKDPVSLLHRLDLSRIQERDCLTSVLRLEQKMI
ncbi:hypothetical protein [Ruegeria atlantica]|uniref:hypothetical protein n=1 Tax=Ruegeria atlantica TaxID=81569 RepID=UPI0014809877|nr:hypothetical protein [Ruegeria atlantica]